MSFDSAADNAAFAEKYRISYPLLSDADAAVAKAYGAFDAQSPGYPRRNTYVIGANGALEQVLEGVNPKTSPRTILDALD